MIQRWGWNPAHVAFIVQKVYLMEQSQCDFSKWPQKQLEKPQTISLAVDQCDNIKHKWGAGILKWGKMQMSGRRKQQEHAHVATVEGHILKRSRQRIRSKSRIKQHPEKVGSQLEWLPPKRAAAGGRKRRLSQMKDTLLKSYWAIFSASPPQKKAREKECTGKSQRKPRSENLKHATKIKDPARNINYTLTFSTETKEACTAPCYRPVLTTLPPLQKSSTLSQSK